MEVHSYDINLPPNRIVMLAIWFLFYRQHTTIIYLAIFFVHKIISAFRSLFLCYIFISSAFQSFLIYLYFSVQHWFIAISQIIFLPNKKKHTFIICYLLLKTQDLPFDPIISTALCVSLIHVIAKCFIVSKSCSQSKWVLVLLKFLDLCS